MIRVFVALATVAGCLMFQTGSVHAQPPTVEPWTFTIDGGGVHQAETDLKDEDGSFNVDRWFLSAGVAYNWDFRNSLGLTVGGGRYVYTFDEATAFGAGDPWGNVQDFRISAPARFKVTERATAILIPTVRWYGESGADSGDSTTYGLFAAVAWRLNSDLTIGPGIGVFSRLEDSTRVFPILAIDWNISEKWNLSTGRGLAATTGPGLTLSYRINNYWSLSLAGRYEDLEFRLDDEGVAPGGIGRDTSFPLVFSGVIEPTKDVRFSLFVGAELGGRLQLKDTFDVTVEETDYKTALLVGATFSVGF